MITRYDVGLDRIAAKPVENGAAVPPGLQVNGLSLAEWVRRVALVAGHKPVTREEAQQFYGVDEVDAVFGPAAPPPESTTEPQPQ